MQSSIPPTHFSLVTLPTQQLAWLMRFPQTTAIGEWYINTMFALSKQHSWSNPYGWRYEIIWHKSSSVWICNMSSQPRYSNLWLRLWLMFDCKYCWKNSTGLRPCTLGPAFVLLQSINAHNAEWRWKKNNIYFNFCLCLLWVWVFDAVPRSAKYFVTQNTQKYMEKKHKVFACKWTVTNVHQIMPSQ